MRHLIERNEIDYDAHADLIYKLSGQVVERVRIFRPIARVSTKEQEEGHSIAA